MAESFFEQLPSLVFHEILKYLMPDLKDVKNLSFCNKFLSSNVLEHVKIKYEPFVHLNAYSLMDLAEKPILHLKVSTPLPPSLYTRQIINVVRMRELRCLEIRKSMFRAHREIQNPLFVRELSEFGRIDGPHHLGTKHPSHFGELINEILNFYPHGHLPDTLMVDVDLDSISQTRQKYIDGYGQYANTNIDFLVNKGLLHSLNAFCTMLESLTMSILGANFRPLELREIEFNLVPKAESDWKPPILCDENITNVECMSEGYADFIKKLLDKANIKCGKTEKITICGIPDFFHKHWPNMPRNVLRSMMEQKWLSEEKRGGVFLPVHETKFTIETVEDKPNHTFAFTAKFAPFI